MKNRSEVIASLAHASDLGRLGLFVGTGFSMALTQGRALSFLHLIKGAARHLRLDEGLVEERYRYKSLPQIATELVRVLASGGMPISEARYSLKKTISELCFLIPDPLVKLQFETALKSAGPSWIVTTNYDLLLESLIDGAQSLLPEDILFPSTKYVPVYHLHGHRHDIDTICVTEEDYVKFLGPIDYKRLRLPLLFLESTTLLLGYSLGDINVRSAISWARSLSSAGGKAGKCGGAVVQALYSASPNPDPYEGLDGEIIIEVTHTEQLLSEIGEAKVARRKSVDAHKEAIRAFLLRSDLAVGMESAGPARNAFLRIIEEVENEVPICDVIRFLSEAINPIWLKARGDNNFPFYDVYMQLLIDILRRIKHRQSNPNLVSFLGDALDNVGSFFNERYTIGSAHAATKTWIRDAPALDKDLLRELKIYAYRYGKAGLRRLMDCNVMQHI